jgi:elongation factor Ts
VVFAKVTSDGKHGFIIVLNCETDFVAKNAEFIAFAEKIMSKAIDKKPSTLDELKAIDIDGGKIGDKIVEYIGKIGEKIELSYFDKIDAEYVQAYIHPGSRLATLAGFTKAGVNVQVYKDVVMQIAAMNPVAVDKKDVSEKMIAQELEIGKEQARREGKPEQMLDKIAEGKLNKFFKESTLLNQEFVKDNKMTIKEYLNSVSKDLTVTEFKRYSLNL